MSTPTHEARLENAGMWKAWVLLCIAEASRMGLTPMATPQLHVVLYLANTLADLFDVTRVRGRVLKHGPFPFFPDVQREIDRLAFAGVLSIERVDFGSKNRLTAHYSLGATGRQIYSNLLNHAEAKRTARLFRELVSACFGRFLANRADIGPIDANYGNATVIDGEVVDFAEWTDENKNIEVAHHLIDRLRALRPDAERDGVRLYCDYLDKAMALT
ncbi:MULTISPECIES: hypothetical protein [Burkholderia]|uniref:hypothetical protein n=1 Tax=Burkholderia TaxID=32008 RepID=UPI00076D523C|nr:MULTISPECIES: hypothetical protein [Burkholderia]KVE38401.1 hypothetical protein WS69_09260 [Burkholderia sp. BDU5]MBU9147478.1 hypothetical protein [Burkholderia multivorans]MBU9516806.1 hypothetical protein [Burkholderia multivorans]MBU9525187.1 hypothetical protein [Burkholderia multivorans]MBU9538663.1 hypothetical protein [Burkholderia multivorans]